MTSCNAFLDFRTEEPSGRVDGELRGLEGLGGSCVKGTGTVAVWEVQLSQDLGAWDSRPT